MLNNLQPEDQSEKIRDLQDLILGLTDHIEEARENLTESRFDLLCINIGELSTILKFASDSILSERDHDPVIP